MTPHQIFDEMGTETRMHDIGWDYPPTLPKNTVDLIEQNTGRKIPRNADGSAKTCDVDTLLGELRIRALEQFYAIGNHNVY
uniref:hypothetical protein n=1 Tax=Sulfuriferula sp. GW6 TaxID=3345112 RepID=UPI0039F71BB6